MRPLASLFGGTMLLLTLATAAVGQQVRPGVYRLDGFGVDLPTADLQPLRQMIGDAPVVALGENVHTSGGYYRMKARVLRFLVRDMGFRAIGFESPWQPADRAAAYVASCSGSPRDAARGLFGVWQAASVRDLLAWMCLWNQQHPTDPVYFFGFDVQQPELDRPALLDFLNRIGLGSGDPRVQSLERCTITFGPELSAADFNACVGALDALWDHFGRQQAAIVSATLRRELELARVRVVGLRSWQSQVFERRRNIHRAFEARDEAMAYVFTTLRELRFPNAKTAIWAHNFHINENGPAARGWTAMGTLLADGLGPSYVSVGLIGHDVHIDWPGAGCGGPTSFHFGDSVEQILHELGEPFLFVDLRQPVADPILQPGRLYVVSDSVAIPRQQYDGLIFLDHSPKMVPLAWPACQPLQGSGPIRGGAEIQS